MGVPESLNDSQLIMDHALCHALFNRKRDTPDAVPGWTLDMIADYHWMLQGEIEKRGFMHKSFDDLDGISVGKSTPDALRSTVSQISASSIYLHPPHAELIWKGEQTLIAKSRNYCGMIGKPLYWGDLNSIFGVLKLTDVESVPQMEFGKLEKEHRVTASERERCWPNSDQLYVYKFDVLDRFANPLDHAYQRGVQVFFPAPDWKLNTSMFTIAVSLSDVVAKSDSSQHIPDIYVTAQPTPDIQAGLSALAQTANVVIYADRDPRYYEMTATWLKKNEIPHSALVFGKPPADVYIDTVEANWGINLAKIDGVLHKSVNHSKCMRCGKPPTIDVRWAEGMARAWFCDECFEAWKKEQGGPWTRKDPQFDPTYTHEKDINYLFRIKDGVAPKDWHEHYGRDERIQKATSEPEGGFYGFYPGRTWEGIRTTSGNGDKGAGGSGALAMSVEDPEQYNPRKVASDQLTGDHDKLHTFWASSVGNSTTTYDQATVRSLHDAVVRELQHRGMPHQTPLAHEDVIPHPTDLFVLADRQPILAAGGYTVAPGGVIGVDNMGAGERVPDNPDKSFKEPTPLQYVHTDEKKVRGHIFFNGKSALDRAKSLYERVKSALEKFGTTSKIDLDADPDGASVSFSAQNSEEVQKSLDSVQDLRQAKKPFPAPAGGGDPLPTPVGSITDSSCSSKPEEQVREG